jgi:L-iditol 2-dehydrogenase
MPGDHAALEPAIYCYHCEFCRTGHHNVCANLRFLSMPEDPGFFRERVNLPAENLLPLPVGMTLEQATLIEPLAVVLHSMKFAALKPGESAAIFGAGPMGLLTIAALKLAGADRVWAVDPVSHRLALAQAAGADTGIDPRGANAIEDILHDTGNRGVDVAIDCGGRDGSINDCIRVARNAGRVVITAIPPETLVPLDISAMRRKEITLFNVRRSNHESAQARQILSENMARFAPMITHTRPLEEIDRAFSQLEGYTDGVGKILITVPADR